MTVSLSPLPRNRYVTRQSVVTLIWPIKSHFVCIINAEVIIDPERVIVDFKKLSDFEFYRIDHLYLHQREFR